MNKEYGKLYDNDRVFLFEYYRLINSTYSEEREKDPITITKIRKNIKPFYNEDEFKSMTNKDVRQHFVDMEFLGSDNPESDEIDFYDGVHSFMNESVDEIIEIFLSSEFYKFLCGHEPFKERRKIIDRIVKYQLSDKRNSEKRTELLKFVIENFYLISDLYLEFKGKFVF